ncbi:hypothetical protein KCU83_g1720, partial [Aureobasidium melanogenum]
MSQIFRFMDLPAELRNRIYSYALSLDFFDKAHEKSFTRGYTHTTKQCNVLLMNHKTSNEAKKIMSSTPITLSYGLELEMSLDSVLIPQMGPDSIRNCFPASRLRNTLHLTISDVGYRGKERDSQRRSTSSAFHVFFAKWPRSAVRVKTSSDYNEYESDSEFDLEEDYGAPKTLKEYHDRMRQGENMPGYFYTESMAAERRQEEHRTRLEWELSNAQLGLILFREDDEESSDDDAEPSEDDDEFSEDDEESL